MEIFTIGFAQKPAAEFFGKLKRSRIRRLVDGRLNNTSQLAGYAKREDLKYFLQAICDADYEHEPLLAPTQEMLDGYNKHTECWRDYEQQFLHLMAERRFEKSLNRERFESVPSVLLRSEHTAECCHGRWCWSTCSGSGRTSCRCTYSGGAGSQHNLTTAILQNRTIAARQVRFDD